VSAALGAGLAASASARVDSGELRRDLAGAASGSEGGQRGGGTRVAPGQECPHGTTETRPGSCTAPSEPPPSILDYRPKSTLVTEEHKVPKAKFPAVDVHGHPGALTSADSINRMVGIMDSLNLKVMLVAESLSGTRLASTLQAINASPHKERFRVLAGVNFSNVGPGWGEKAAAQLEADVKAGAIGVGEVGKQFGLRITKPDGSRLKLDDPEMDPLWAAFARLDVPAFIHTAEPQEFFQPQDMKNERWLELALFADRRNNQPGQVTFEQLMTERNNLFRKHPKTRFVAAHFGWHANDLGRLSKLLDEFPNVTIEAGAILYDLGRQPRAAREFFIKYGDRIMFGKDSFQPEEYPYYWRVFETADEYFDYYRDYHAFWKMYGMSLPDDVLKKVYYKTALKVFKGLPQAGWPQ
jgi:predicted TIM-barrel fold metal-dependent hydrolase